MVAILVQVLILFGFIIPALISAASWIAVICGAALAVLYVPVAYKQGKSVYNEAKERWGKFYEENV